MFNGFALHTLPCHVKHCPHHLASSSVWRHSWYYLCTRAATTVLSASVPHTNNLSICNRAVTLACLFSFALHLVAGSNRSPRVAASQPSGKFVVSYVCCGPRCAPCTTLFGGLVVHPSVRLVERASLVPSLIRH